MIDIEDRLAIEDLHSRFIHAADRRDYPLLRSLYGDDAIDNHGLYNGPVDGYIDWLKLVQDSFEMTTHVITNIIAAVDGDDAESEARGTAYLRLRTEPQHNMIVINRHFDRYRRVNARWYFAYRSLCIDWVQSFPPGGDSLDLVRANPVGVMGPSDPVYSRLPMMNDALRSTIVRR